MPTVGLDATYSVGADLSGVGAYSRAILRGLPAAHPEASYRFYYRPHRFLRSLGESVPARRLLLDALPPRVRLFHGLNQRLPRPRLERAVCTFHDLFVMTGDYSTPEFRARFTAQAREAASRAALIVAVSEFTAGQVEACLNVERARIRVIHHGATRPSPAPLCAREPLILHVGAIQKRKNIARLVEAFERTPPGWRLVLAGSAGFGAAGILDRIARSPRRADIETPGYVEAAELARLYARASIFAFPSLDEGFGMPVLDAMAAGVSVLTSRRSALAEVAGGAALLVDPESTDEIAAGLTDMVNREDLRTGLALRGLQRAEAFTWQAAVEKTWQVYGELLD